MAMSYSSSLRSIVPFYEAVRGGDERGARINFLGQGLPGCSGL